KSAAWCTLAAAKASRATYSALRSARFIEVGERRFREGFSTQAAKVEYHSTFGALPRRNYNQRIRHGGQSTAVGSHTAGCAMIATDAKAGAPSARSAPPRGGARSRWLCCRACR